MSLDPLLLENSLFVDVDDTNGLNTLNQIVQQTIQ